MSAIAFTVDGTDIVVDADLLKLHPDMVNNRWRGEESYRIAILEAYNRVIFDLKNLGLVSAYITDSDANLDWFKRVLIYQALMIIFRDFRAHSEDRWGLLIGDYQVLYNQAMKSPSLDYSVPGTSSDAAVVADIRMVR